MIFGVMDSYHYFPAESKNFTNSYQEFKELKDEYTITKKTITNH
jgi:hypothetical protein